MTVVRLLLAACFALTVPLIAQPRRPWQWTDAERIAARADRHLAEERIAAHGHRLAPSSSSPAISATPAGDVIDGHVHPELFFRWELFRLLLNGAFAPSEEGRRIFREARAELAPAPLPPEFWSRLEAASRDYLRINDAARALNARAGSARGRERDLLTQQSNALQAGQCANLTRALETARASFGAEAFDRFLYESVAPTATITLAEPQTPAQLAYAAGGCR